MATQQPTTGKTFTDPICGMTVDPATAAGSYEHNGETFYFCSNGCMQKFISQAQTAPVQIGRAKAGDHEHMHSATHGSEIDPVCGMKVDPATAAAEYEYDGKKYYFCAVRCKERFASNPDSFLSSPPASADGPGLSVPSASADGSKSAIPNPQSQIPNIIRPP
jgi:P-type Cu+ transporter